MFCPYCHAKGVDNLSLCLKCGKSLLNVKKESNLTCGICNSYNPDDAIYCWYCGGLFKKPSKRSVTDSEPRVSSYAKSSPKGYGSKAKWGCLGCFGLIVVIIIAAQLIKTPQDTKTSQGENKRGDFNYLMNTSEWLVPGQRAKKIISFEKGGAVGELFGYNTMIRVKIIRASDNKEIPYKILVDRGTFTRMQWNIPTTDKYYVIVENISQTTKTDYIIKIWKGIWRQ